MRPARRRDQVLQVTGGVPLRGRLCVSGSKNATLPLMAASLLTRERVRLSNVPRILDVEVMRAILTGFGVSVRTLKGGEGLSLRSDRAQGGAVPAELGTRMRATIELLGPLLGRFGQAAIPRPGGDEIGARRYEQHVRGLRQMGAEVKETETELVARARRLRGGRVFFDLPTVSGTENILMAAALAEGRTEIFNAAREPHVQDLCRLLTKMGAQIHGVGSDVLVVEGVERLGGADHEVIPDYLEAGTYAIAAAAAGGEVLLECSPPEDLTSLLLKLEQAGCHVETGKDWIRVAREPRAELRPVDMSTWTFPGFPTDLQAQYMALMTQAEGTTVVSEYVHENRFQHVKELARMGARITVESRLHAIVEGPTRLQPTVAAIPDIRSGAALVVAALCAPGTSVLHNAWHVDRGYQDLPGKLAGLGAKIIRTTTSTRAAPSARTYE
ncbi:MAG TPA: UDP-N-acetylglucosamine 1-carboxyvinyltransferase [Candidatus Acidoferrales bacterium]|nr:UDP-N-acetylglucosamine 1-carboxyvinyltransferase [Candidatus Acidoferrales bacterium]